MSTLILAAFLNFITPAMAGQETHGGDVLVCEGQSPVVLDYYIANLPTVGNPIARENLEGLSSLQVFNFLIDKFGNSYVGDILNLRRSFYINQNNWIVAEGLEDINDDGLAIKYPSGCALKQVAVRNSGAIYFSGPIVNQLSEVQFGILLVHEILYEMAIYGGKSDSANVKSVVRTLLKTEIGEQELEEAATSLGHSLSYLKEISKISRNRKYTCTECSSDKNTLTLIGVDEVNSSVRFLLSNSHENSSLNYIKIKCDKLKEKYCKVSESNWPKTYPIDTVVEFHADQKTDVSVKIGNDFFFLD